MLEYLSYVLCFLMLAMIIIYIYVHLKYGFWVLQPVFHIYNLSYMLNPPGIIEHMLPKTNKYTNFKDIITYDLSKITALQTTRFTNLITSNYLRNKDNIFSPSSQNIIPYFTGYTNKSLISFYYSKVNMINIANKNIVTDEKIIGAITSRSVSVIINNDKKNPNITFNSYYVDYLCIDKLYRKKGIAPQLIQTHEYNQRYINKNISVSIFKREDELTGIVPLCVYSTYGFYVDTWVKPIDFSAEYSLLEINKQNFRFLYDFIKNNNNFDIIIKTEIANIIELINTKNIFVYAVLCDDNILCCYFYRKSCVQIEKGLEVLSCFASICNCDENIFIQGFKISFWKISAENYFGFCAIENISHNNLIINNIVLKTKPTIISPTAYFFYNFAYPSFSSDKVLFIN